MVCKNNWRLKRKDTKYGAKIFKSESVILRNKNYLQKKYNQMIYRNRLMCKIQVIVTIIKNKISEKVVTIYALKDGEFCAEIVT